MNSKDIKRIRRLYRLSASELGKIAGVEDTTVRNWEQGRPINRASQMLIERWLKDLSPEVKAYFERGLK